MNSQLSLEAAKHGTSTSPNAGASWKGLTISVLGVDGSGKTTLQQELCCWLQREHEVVSIYFGSGKGPMSHSRRLLSFVGRTRHFFMRNREVSSAATTEKLGSRSSESSDPALRPRLRFILDSLLVARERKRSLKKMLNAKAAGSIVITDRFPQIQVLDGMDGPRLHSRRTSSSSLMRVAANWEFHIYQLVVQHQPDLVIVLSVSPDVAAGRSGFHSVDSIKNRIGRLSQLDFPESVLTLIDADQPFEVVLEEAKRSVGKHLPS